MMTRAILIVAFTCSIGPASGQAPASQTPSYGETLELARASLARKDSASALGLLDQALRLNPEGSDAFVLLGRAYAGLGRYAEATAALQRATTLIPSESPEWVEARYLMADSLARQERNEEALQALADVEARVPSRRGVHLDMGQIHLAVGRLEAAATEFKKEIALAGGGEPDALLRSARQGLGIASYRMGENDAALASLKNAADTVETRYHLGLTLARLSRNEEAAAQLRDVLKLEPDHRGALQNLARCAAALGLTEERQRLFTRFDELYRKDEEAHALRIKVRDLRSQADERRRAEDLGGACDALRRALLLEPGDVALMIDVGQCLGRTGHPQPAEETLRGALAVDPLNALGHYSLGRILADRERLPEALEELKTAARLEPMSITYHTALGQIYARMKRADEGVAELRLARRLAPASPDAAFNLGLGLAQAGALAQARDEMQAALELGFARPQIHQMLAQIYRGLGDLEQSAKEQELFERLTSPSPEAPPAERPKR
ncbi:MAG TPA: tetratricopeptide repeat protein [Candidatus Polarisedimenticolia bacterium]|nr:tetratricopeptide repeat protein [Candidatus Polarisedimenticolia bacterium]